MSDDLVVKLKRLRKFLDGSGELSLQTFGGEVRGRPKYWWRKYLSRIDDAISRIESLQAKVAELEEENKAWEDDSIAPELQFLCKRHLTRIESLEAQLAKYEDKVLPEEVTRQVERLRLQCIWQRMQGTDRDNGYPYYKHLPDCDICRSAELIERLSREKP